MFGAEARKNWAGSGDEGIEKIWFEMFDKLGKSEFLGYTCTKADGQITALVQNGQPVESVNGGEFYLIANQTPFYGESGGQVGDIGRINGKDFAIEVTDTKKKIDGMVVHCCKMIDGTVKTGDIASFEVDEKNRDKIRANHSVTHLLHRALRDILGDHVTQKGSYVCAGRARFDISHPKQITNEELRKAEDIVNAAVRKNYKTVTRIMTPDEAIKLGAMALFGEKYGETVRVVSMENDDEVFSRELCGGTHVRSTGDIGYVNIVSESAVAAGIRRVEFVTGHAAEKYAQDIEDKLHDISKILKTNTNDLEARINLLLEDKKRLETEILNGLTGQFAVLEQQQGGDAHDAELSRQLGLLVHVHLAHLDVGALLGHLVHDGAEHPAGAAPAGPEVQQDGLGAPEHLSVEVFFRDGDDCHIYCLLKEYFFHLTGTVYPKARRFSVTESQKARHRRLPAPGFRKEGLRLRCPSGHSCRRCSSPFVHPRISSPLEFVTVSSCPVTLVTRAI